MTKEIEMAMENEIQQLPWMGEETKKRAIEKLHSVVNKIGYPDKWRDYSSIKHRARRLLRQRRARHHLRIPARA